MTAHVDISTTDAAHETRTALDRDLFLEEGGIRDYDVLGRFHYRAGRPATWTRVLLVRRDGPTVVGRYLGRRREREVVGLLVVSRPHLACRMRDVVTRGRYAKLPKGMRGMVVNREVRTISRVIVDPRYRGLGLAVSLVRHALERAETPYTEALAAMGRVHPFFEKAGMSRYDVPPRPEHARLFDALERLSIAPAALVSKAVMTRALREVDHRNRRWIERELRRWYRLAGGTRWNRVSDASLDEILIAARDRALTRSTYYIAYRPADACARASPEGS